LNTKTPKQNLLLVVREGLVEEVKSYFRIEDALVITSLSVLES
jgi:hypothetical protein